MGINRILLLATFSAMVACNQPDSEPSGPPSDLGTTAFIPKPVSVTASGKWFKWNQGAAISSGNDELSKLGQTLSKQLSFQTGIEASLTNTPDSSKGNLIVLSLDANDASLGTEGYKIDISTKAILLHANQPAGIYMGMQTLRQIFPDHREPGANQGEEIKIPTGSIVDYPSYGFRSSMLDLGRHFLDMEIVKNYIDLISFYKMNYLHLHLSDDQGWRIEIKSWPKLAEYGGSTQVDGGKGGYFTQDQYRELVKYAQDHFITIIPEIDMPGHTNAALASYPELNCSGTSPKLYTGTEVGFSTLCVRKDITYKFIDDVVRELAEMTPGPYIHLGGDESHATKKDDYLYFVNKVQEIPKKYGKQMIGWEEIAQANLDPSTVVQFWTNPVHAQEAVKKGAKVIMSPASRVYLDMKYDSTTSLGLEWAGRIEVDSAYDWTLSTRVPGLAKENILGVEAPLWTETIRSQKDLEFMVFPRLPGIAELGWSSENGRSWEEYRIRLAKHAPRMDALGIHYYHSGKVDWPVGVQADSNKLN